MDKFLVVFSFLVGLWLLCRTVLEPVAVVTGFQNMAVMCDAVHQRQATRQGSHFPSAPIGLYFARLWYHERLYPMIWTLQALQSARQRLSETA